MKTNDAPPAPRIAFQFNVAPLSWLWLDTSGPITAAFAAPVPVAVTAATRPAAAGTRRSASRGRLSGASPARLSGPPPPASSIVGRIAFQFNVAPLLWLWLDTSGPITAAFAAPVPVAVTAVI